MVKREKTTLKNEQKEMVEQSSHVAELEYLQGEDANKSSQENKQDLDSVDSCQICFERYSAVQAHKPMTIDCGHSLCAACVSLLAKKKLDEGCED